MAELIGLLIVRRRTNRVKTGYAVQPEGIDVLSQVHWFFDIEGNPLVPVFLKRGTKSINRVDC